MSEALSIQDNQFDEIVAGSSIPVVVDFWAPWCGPCKMTAPVIDALAADLDGKVLFVKINVDDNQTYATKYGVQGIPTFLFFKDGEVVERLVGALPEAPFREAVDEAFDLKPA